MIDKAILKINPNAIFTISAKKKDKDNIDAYTIQWLEGTPEISKADIKKKINETQYQRDRAKEYPDFKEYLDGIVKGDQAQIDKYIADCLAVKAKYPK